ncbi:metallophosphoesterase, partial [Halobacillus sp. BBL2006]|uniref:metallophosphoesterase n=1 Tax=Halobacillus sp. BBL2006 TaxID=1543706 RepID=UPI0018CDE727
MFWLLASLMTPVLLLYLYMRFSAQNDRLDHHVVLTDNFTEDTRLHIFFISDIHNRVIKESTLQKIEEVDVVIVGGDLVDKRTTMSQLKHNLSALKRWKAPIYFIPGNNDHELVDYDVVDVLESEDVNVLSNGDATITLEYGQSFLLSGTDPYFLKPRKHMHHIDSIHPYQ